MFISRHPFYLVFSLPFLGCRPSPQREEEEEGHAISRKGTAKSQLFGEELKSQSSHHLSPNPPSTLLNLCKWTKQKKMERDVCHHTGDLVSGPKHNSVSMYAQKLKISLPRMCQLHCLWHKTKGACRCSHQQRPGGDHLGTQSTCHLLKGVLLGSRNRHSSTVSGPFFLRDRELRELISSLSCILEWHLCRQVGKLQGHQAG